VLTTSYFGQVLTKERKRRREAAESEDSGADEEAAAAEKPKKKRKSRKASEEGTQRVPRKKPGDEGYDPYDFDSEAEDSQEGESQSVAGSHVGAKWLKYKVLEVSWY